MFNKYINKFADKLIGWLFPTFEKFACKALLLTGLAMLGGGILNRLLVFFLVTNEGAGQNVAIEIIEIIGKILSSYEPYWGLVLIILALMFWLINKLIDKMKGFEQTLKDENDRKRFSELIPHIPELPVKQMLNDLKAQHAFIGSADDQLDNLVDVLSQHQFRFNNKLIERDRSELIKAASSLRQFCYMNMFPHAHCIRLRPDQRFNRTSKTAQIYYQEKANELVALARTTEQAYDVFREHISMEIHV